MSDQFLLDQITEIETIIESINTAIKNVLMYGHSSYSLNSGQSEQKVSRLDLDKLRLMRKEYMKERNNLMAACGLTRSVVVVTPGF